MTVAQLAARADLDLDDTLVSLWGAGIDEVDDPDDVIPPKLLKTAEAALGIENPRRQTRIDYWLKRTGMTRDEFVEDVAQIGVRIKPNVKTLPKGACAAFVGDSSRNLRWIRKLRQQSNPLLLSTIVLRSNG